jgi:DNA adenine methylase
VVYCDPPYAGTTAYAGAPTWDAEKFWTTMRRWSADGATVFVSEYSAPAGVECVWSAEVRTSLKSTDNQGTVSEKLFRL